MSRCGSNDTSHSGWRPNRTREPGANSWRWPRRLPATWSMTTRTDPMVSPAAEPPRDDACDDRDRRVGPPREPRDAQPAARRTVDVLLGRQRGRRQPDPDVRAQHRVLAGDRNRGWNGRGRDADPRGQPACDVGGRRQGRVALLLRVELAEGRQVVLTAGRQE